MANCRHYWRSYDPGQFLPGNRQDGTYYMCALCPAYKFVPHTPHYPPLHWEGDAVSAYPSEYHRMRAGFTRSGKTYLSSLYEKSLRKEETMDKPREQESLQGRDIGGAMLWQAFFNYGSWRATHAGLTGFLYYGTTESLIADMLRDIPQTDAIKRTEPNGLNTLVYVDAVIPRTKAQLIIRNLYSERS